MSPSRGRPGADENHAVDYTAEFRVAADLAAAGWQIYFPSRDTGFDFLVMRDTANDVLIRPVQVTSKLPDVGTTDRKTYGTIRNLSRVHPDMVLAIAFYEHTEGGPRHHSTAYLPMSRVVHQTNKKYRCEPARIDEDGRIHHRRDFAGFFDDAGIWMLPRADWATSPLTPLKRVRTLGWPG